MAGSSLRKELVEPPQGVPGWRLEPRTTPGATPLWCFVSDGKIEFSVSVEGSALLLYDMDSDREQRFSDRDALASWLQEHRPDTLQEAPRSTDGKKKVRKMLRVELRG